MLSIAEQAIIKGVTAVCCMRNSFLRRRRRSTPQPLTGEPSGRQSPPKSLSCKGRWMRRRAQTEGCIAGLRQKYPARPGRALPCPRRGRCLHRPGNPAVAQSPGGGRQPRRILARQGAAPLRRLGRHLPLQGRLYRRQFSQSLPCKGRWMRHTAQTEGCIAGLRRKYPARLGRTLPCLRRGRCSHRPGNLAVAQGPRGGEAVRRHTCGIKISVVKAPSSLLRVR